MASMICPSCGRVSPLRSIAPLSWECRNPACQPTLHGPIPDPARKRRELAERIWRAIVGWKGGDIIADIEGVLAEQEGK